VTFMRKDQQTHLNVFCNYKLVDCEYCNSKVKRGDRLYHLSECGDMIIDCELRCGEKFQRKERNLHKEKCLEEIIGCAGIDMGCDFIEKRVLVEKHEKSCVIIKMSPQIRSLIGKVDSLEKQNDSLLKQVESLRNIKIDKKRKIDECYIISTKNAKKSIQNKIIIDELFE